MPYDVFISHKQLDEHGLPTRDSQLARELHDYLSMRGLSVFLSSVTLEQLGAAAYKSAIDDALDDSRVLIAVGTSVQNLKSTWVRYEWDSFFSDILCDVKPDGRVFTYIEGIGCSSLPHALRQVQSFMHAPDAPSRLYNFIAALGGQAAATDRPAPSVAPPRRIAPAPGYPDPRILVHDKDGSTLVWIPEGEFLQGHRKLPVLLPGFWLSAHAVTNSQYLRFVTETGHPGPDRCDGGGAAVWLGRSFPPELADHPVVCVSAEDAHAYCDWAGLRLPTSIEWEKGARGVDGRRYPWGDSWSPAFCRNATNRKTGSTADVWSYPEGRSPWGLYQMAGNTWEWCRPPESEAPPRGTAPSVAKGGSWLYSEREYFRSAYCHSKLARHSDTRGFRCAAGSAFGASRRNVHGS
jgi:hypothetical protein